MRTSARAAVIVLSALGLMIQPTLAEPWPTQVNALYKIKLAGFEIGNFRFQSSVSGQSYALAGNAELSAAFGAWRWNGQTRSSGQLTSQQPRPQAFTFDYLSNTKSGSVKMSFADGAISNYVVLPPSTPGPGTVPLEQQHLKNVFDPMTAILALARSTGGNPCGRRIAIFDGKQRFDLVLSFRRQEPVTEARPSGQPSIAYVCRVQYIPVAGYRMNAETRQMATSSAIEVVLRPVPSANLFVPYEVRIPTIVGSAILTSLRIDIVAPGNKQIALVH